MNRRKHLFSSILILVLTVACSRGGIFTGKVPVTVEKVSVEIAPTTLKMPATLEPSAKATYRFPLAVRPEKIQVQLGSKVAAGDPLFDLNEVELALATSKLRAQLAKQQGTLEKNSYFYENRARLLEEGKIDQSQYDSLESEVKISQGEVDQLKAEIGDIENQVGRAHVTAPFDGMITTLTAVAGVSLAAGDPILTVVKIDPIMATFQLPAEEATSVTAGMSITVTVEGLPQKEWPATITLVQPEINTATHTVEAKAGIPNKEGAIKSGMEAAVMFVSQRPVKQLKVPAQAIIQGEGKDFVYVIKNNRAWPVRVYPKPNDDNPSLVAVDGTLTEDAMVVTEGQDKLKAGTEVNLWR